MNYRCYQIILAKNSSVGIGTDYGLDGWGIESWWGRDFLHPALEPNQPPMQWVPDLSRGYSGLGVALITTPSSAEVKERVELYLYSPLWAFVACRR
jgi:hypothetical protein